MDMVREQPQCTTGEDQGHEVIREQEAIDTLTGGFGRPQEAEGTLPGRESELQEVDLKGKGKLVETAVINQEPGGQGKRRVKHTSVNGRGQPGTEKIQGESSQVPEVSLPELPPVQEIPKSPIEITMEQPAINSTSELIAAMKESTNNQVQLLQQLTMRLEEDNQKLLMEREQWTRKYHRATQRSEAQEEELEHLETELASWKEKAHNYQDMVVKEVVRPEPGTSNQGEIMIGLYEELAQAKAQELQHQEARDKLIAELQVSAIQVQGLQEQVAKLKEEIKDSEQFVADTVLQSQNAAFQED